MPRTHDICYLVSTLASLESSADATDLIDFLEPTMVIVGSRGLGKLKGILLGSTSHYLVQKSSVPVMVSQQQC